MIVPRSLWSLVEIRTRRECPSDVFAPFSEETRRGVHVGLGDGLELSEAAVRAREVGEGVEVAPGCGSGVPEVVIARDGPASASQKTNDCGSARSVSRRPITVDVVRLTDGRWRAPRLIYPKLACARRRQGGSECP